MINTWFKFKSKIQNGSKVIAFSMNHTDHNDDDNETKNNMSPPLGPLGGG